MSEMTPGMRARLDRGEMLLRDVARARRRAGRAAAAAAEAFTRLGSTLQGAYDDEVAGHPDLAELNVRMDALYEP